jgi:glycosyltransferase involved in cell wall biosynthesis
MGYQIPVFQEYVKNNCEVFVVHDVKGKMSRYEVPYTSGVLFLDKDSFQENGLQKFVFNIDPDIVYVSGWMYSEYVKLIYKLRKRGKPVVVGFDDIWWKTLRQRVASFIFPILKKKFFSCAWVAGPYQYEFAKRLGFKNHEIIYDCLSADITLFNQAYTESIDLKRNKYPHVFLYVGRLEPIKGVDLLIKAWNNIKDKKKDWKLYIIGNGSLTREIINSTEINFFEFMQPEALINQVKNCGCFILPSRKEQWSLVLHEFTAAGLPIICSDVCGAAPVFLIENYNGYKFRVESIKSLENKMLRIINSSDETLIKMTENSHNMGQKINPQMSAASFLSLLN